MAHKNFPKSNTVRQVVTTTGGWLKLNTASVALSIPEASIAKSQKQSIFLSILNEDSIRASIPDICTNISPIVHCGPVDTNLNKPAIIKMPHCAENVDNWRISLYYSNAHIQDAEPKWRKIVTLGEETINTPTYIQMDESAVFIMTEFLGRFALIGESLSPATRAVKRLRLLVFGPSVQTSADCNIRVYVIEDLPSSRDYCCSLECRLGGIILGQSSAFAYEDNGQDLNVNIKCLGGWQSKTGSENQTIPFSHVWNNSLALHCAFAIERNDQDTSALKIEVIARQRQGGEVIVTHIAPFLPIDMQIMSGAISDDYSDIPVRPTVTVSDKGINTCHDPDVAFKLTRQSKRDLCACLDPPTNRGNDWRMLAQRLRVDRYITYFATKPSPTEQILDLWECRNRDASALTDLIAIFRSMGRTDAVDILEKSVGPLWL